MEGITTTVYDAALMYVRRGWPVIAVHGQRDGVCTCGESPCGRDNRNAGKHPVRAGWQRGGLTSTADAYAAFCEEGPDWNVGILTGAPSGFFVVDVDAEAGGLESLADLERSHGPLPETLTFATGGGGRHLLFAMPAGFDVRNNSRKLAPGIDVRGTGGMIVAPPSVSGKGAYRVIGERPIADPPTWLEEAVRPAPGVELADAVVIEDLPAWSELDAETRARVGRYAKSVLEREARAYTDAAPGTGNATLFQAACNVLEVVQSPWNLLTETDALHALEAARQLRITLRQGAGGQGPEEFRKTYLSARGKVTGQGRPLPAPPMDGILFDPFPGAGAPAAPAADQAGAPAPAPPLSRLDWLRGQLLTAAQVAAQPPPKPLVVGWLDLDSEAWMIGAPGTFKSFVALDLAGHVGRGLPWLGRRTAKAAVLYMVAEGAGGMALRVRAWEAKHGPMEGVVFLPLPVQVADREGWAALIALAGELDPGLVIIDTQARVTVGLNEQAAEQMGLYVEAVRQLRVATRATVLTVHHTGRDGKNARGSSAIDGAQDTELKLERLEAKGLQVKLLTEKQKNGSDTAEAVITLEPYDEGVDAETGRPLTSLVAAAGSPFDQPKPERAWVEGLPDAEQKIVTVLLDHTDHRGVTAGEIRKMISERFAKPMNVNTFNSARVSLAKKNVITNGVGSVGQTLGARWALTSRVDAFLADLEV